MKVFLFAIVLCSTACDKNPIRSETKQNGVKVELIIEHEGCKVYRFYDGRKVYFTDCSSVTHRYSCGKNCIKSETIPTNKR